MNRALDEARFPDAAYDVVGVAASAGGVVAVGAVLADLPVDFPAAVVVVQHLDPRHESLMARIVSRKTSLHAKQAEQGEALKSGTVFLAPPDQHLLVNADGTMSLTSTELVNFVRPSADLLFESLAASHRDRTIAVVLSGTGKDGAMGVRAVKAMGGTVIVQEPQHAEFSGMPKSAIETGDADYVLPLEEIGPAVTALVQRWPG